MMWWLHTPNLTLWLVLVTVFCFASTIPRASVQYPLFFKIARKNVCKNWTQRRSHCNSINLIIQLTIKHKMASLGSKNKQIIRTERGRWGGSAEAYNLSRQIFIVSSSGTLANNQNTYLVCLPTSLPSRILLALENGLWQTDTTTSSCVLLMFLRCSPLGPVLVNIFMCDFGELKCVSNNNDCPTFWF